MLVSLSGCSAPPPPPVEEYLRRVEEIGEPDFDAARKQEPGYMEAYRSAQHALYQRKAAVLLELARSWPDNPRIGEWLQRRWTLLGWNQDPADVAEEVLADIDAILAAGEGVDAAVREQAEYLRGHYGLALSEDPTQRLAIADRYASLYPKNERSAELLARAAENAAVPVAMRRRIYERLVGDYPETHYGTYAPGWIRQLEAIGQPFNLEFEDAVSGRQVSLADLRGKVVAIDFWATSCAPCVAELPNLIELYERHRPAGFEIVGVSVDEPEMLEALREFVSDHTVPWPQYYQGGGYLSDYSLGWGIGSAPTAFLIDRDGILRATDAQGRLEELVPQLLAEAGS